MIKNLRVCEQGCKVPHYENCETCFGFGVYSQQPGDIVRAYHAQLASYGKQLKSEVHPCPECGSTEKGLPEVA